MKSKDSIDDFLDHMDAMETERMAMIGHAMDYIHIYNEINRPKFRKDLASYSFYKTVKLMIKQSKY